MLNQIKRIIIATVTKYFVATSVWFTFDTLLKTTDKCNNRIFFIILASYLSHIYGSLSTHQPSKIVTSFYKRPLPPATGCST